MLGTIVNVCTIVTGSMVGSALKTRINPACQKVMYNAMGLASLALGLNAVCKYMPQSQYPILFILSLSIGGLLGTVSDLDARFKRLVDKM